MRIETKNTSGPECPYCEHVQDHDGGLFYDEYLTELECEACGHVFNVSVYTETTWTCTPKKEDE
jgi:DNA-directed RNA polymerase subunit RPC12/RpoP